MTAPQIMTTGAVVSAQGAFSTAHGPMTKAAASVMTMPSSMFMSWMACGRELQHDARKGAREAKDGRHAHEVEARRGGVLVKRQDEHDGDREAEAHEHHQKAGEKGGTLHVE